MMRLLVTTPLAIVVDDAAVAHVRAEDATGAFGILPGHADFLTVLAISVLSWRDARGGEHHVAVRGGVLAVRDHSLVEVATPQAVGEETLGRLGLKVLDELRREAAAEGEASVATAHLEVRLLRQLRRYLDTRHAASRGGLGRLGNGELAYPGADG